ncbi:hypothetical protein H5410_009814 [Solanum commersonii]|uniref:Uncharacterized protein n=1 Tax=Solanum commersonii TaxID=4109 RepID=A0A9J6AJU3_SOLCO|nr:hypothetical protein H5410_009814 [Solanum commersonii]
MYLKPCLQSFGEILEHHIHLCGVHLYETSIAKNITLAYIWWQIKVGSSIFWFNNWTIMSALYYFDSATTSEEKLEVNEFIIEGTWDEQKLTTKLSSKWCSTL